MRSLERNGWSETGKYNNLLSLLSQGCDTIPNRSYEKGYRFEAKTRKAMQGLGYKVIRQHKSAFPDLICLKPFYFSKKPIRDWETMVDLGEKPIIIECKYNKYISKKERERFKEWAPHGRCLIAYPQRNTHDRRMVDVVICDLDYKEVARL